jgi:hypothetical protein
MELAVTDFLGVQENEIAKSRKNDGTSPAEPSKFRQKHRHDLRYVWVDLGRQVKCSLTAN